MIRILFVHWLLFLHCEAFLPTVSFRSTYSKGKDGSNVPFVSQKVSNTQLAVRPLQQDVKTEKRLLLKDEVLQLVGKVPQNVRTPRRLTRDILRKIDDLERICPTPDEEVLENLGGHWELLWTAQVRGNRTL